MHILLACAKTMADVASGRIINGTTMPQFARQASIIAADMSRYSVDELTGILHVKRDIAAMNFGRYKQFDDPMYRRPAALLYDGIVFKKLALWDFSDSELLRCNDRLSICSFIYGLVRPLDLINPYRLEGDIELPCTGGVTLFKFWQPLLTDALISRVNESGGVLMNLASNEMKSLFDWRKVNSSVKVVSPTFKVLRNGRLQSVTVYAKMCRGAMARHLLSGGKPETFEYDGFALHDERELTYVKIE